MFRDLLLSFLGSSIMARLFLISFNFFHNVFYVFHYLRKVGRLFGQ